MFKGGFPPIYSIDPDSNIKTNDHIKRNFSSNNIIDINSILLNKKSSNIDNMLNLSEPDKTDNIDNDKNKDKDNKKKKNRNFKSVNNEQNFIDFIYDLTNIKQMASRIKKSSKKKSSKKKI